MCYSVVQYYTQESSSSAGHSGVIGCLAAAAHTVTCAVGDFDLGGNTVRHGVAWRVLLVLSAATLVLRGSLAHHSRD